MPLLLEVCLRPEDQKLINLFLDGDHEAIKTIEAWIQHASQPYKKRANLDFEDLHQDIRLEILRLLREGRFRGDASLKTYLWRVINHSCIDYLRKQKRHPQALMGELAEHIPNLKPNALHAVLSHESSQFALQVVGQISEKCRELWQMILNEMSYRQMSEKMEVAEGTLRVRVLRCRQQALALRDKQLNKNRPRQVTNRANPRR